MATARRVLGRGTPRALQLLAVFVLLTLLAAACGSGGDGSDQSGTGPDDSATDTASGDGDDDAASSGDSGGDGDATFRMAMPAVPNTLDIAVYEGTPTSENGVSWGQALYEYTNPEGIAEEDLGSTGLDSVAPLLVESDEEEEDGSLVITLKEAQSAYGNTLSSEDVQWSFERAIANDFVAQFVLSVGRVDTENPIEIIDERTFRLNVTQPNPFVRGVLTLFNLSPLDSTEAKKHITDDDEWASGWLESNTATYGAYSVAAFRPGEQITLEANPNYWGDAPAYSRVVMQAVPDAGSRLQLLTRGEVDYAHGLQPDQFASLQDSEDVDTAARQSNTLVMIELNHRFEAFQDPRVRQAIAYAIDRDAIVEGPMRGFATALGTFISPGIQQPDPPEPYTYDPDRARELLAEAGAEGLSFPLTINLARPGPFAEQIAVLLEQQLEAVGMQVDIETIASSSEFEKRKVDGELTAWLGANTPIVPEPWYQMQLDHHSQEAFQNYKAYNNPEFDALLADLRDTPSGAERDEKIQAVHELAMEDVPYVPIFGSKILVAVNSDIDISTVRAYSPHGPFAWEIRPD
jgi:peptide/nickel transport system substrate-binding protein